MANNISFTRGDTKVIALDVMDDKGLSYTPATNDILTMTVRDREEVEVIRKETGYGTDVMYKEGGLQITLRPEDTSSLPYGQYFYDIQVVLEDAYTQTIIPYSTMTLLQEVTY